MTNKCKKAYATGKAHRVLYPLASGANKIREAAGRYDNFPDIVQRYGEYSSLSLGKRKSFAPPYSPCMPYEASWWTRRVPEELCKTLASKICHAVPKLVVDDVPISVVQKLELWLKEEVPLFIRAAEAARLDSKRPWKERARELANRQGQLYDLMEYFVFITDRIKTWARLDRSGDT
jgi:hypothetical protein